MTIRPPHCRVTVLMPTVADSIDLIDRSGVVTTIDEWIAEDRRTSRAGIATTAYPTRALLIGLHLLVVLGLPLSWTELLILLTFEVSDAHRRLLHIEAVIPAARAAMFQNKVADPDAVWTAGELREWKSEYSRITASLDAVFATMRWSPHTRSHAQRNSALRQRQAAVTVSEQETLDRNRERHDTVTNRIIVASVDPTIIANHTGDVIFDEVVVQTAIAFGRDRGTRLDKKHSGNPDAEWWRKGDTDTPRWGHGLTYVMVTNRPGETSIPTTVVGMTLDKPTGGRVRDVVSAIDYAERNHLLRPHNPRGRRDRYGIADMGYTIKNHMAEALHDKGYKIVRDYPSDAPVRHVVDKDAIVFQGWLVCPGVAAATATRLTRPAHDDSPADVAKHAARLATLTAGRLRTQTGFHKPVKVGRGRPQSTAPTADVGMRTQVTCPAANFHIRCPIVPDSMTQNVPSVLNPPNPACLPGVCKNTTSSLILTSKLFKNIQPLIHGSQRHAEIYEHGRQVNEQYHSQVRNRHTAGIGNSAFNTLGQERIGVILALATAVTNRAMFKSHRRKTAA